MTVQRWLDWARRLQALAEAAQHYARNQYERERAEKLLDLAAEIIAEHSTLPAAEARTAFTAQPGYVTPKVDVRGAVFRDGQLLLVRESIDGGWTFPGGWADVGEEPHVAAEREVFEESGLRVKAVRLVGVYDANRVEGSLPLFHAYKLLFLCEIVGGKPATSSETSEVSFFDPDALPGPLSNYRTTPRHLEDAIARYRDPARAAVFD
jgi:ADP-ribose pyrophosphatase YjhB (NUDIX family)